ncbi:MAG: lytic murein transglycosylase B [Cellvibrionaceae bacterium]|nr:lytic murein transglycosylase B [Cellvibrionaceae bacterium]
MKLRFWRFAVWGMCMSWAGQVAADYSQHPEVPAFIDRMVKEYGFDAKSLRAQLAQAEQKQAILDAIARPAEKTKPWHEYRKIFLDQARIDQGVEFWLDNAATLKDVSERYGVDESIIVAIIGVETRYGRHMGNYRVIDALATLGFDYPPRATFFRGQLEQLFLLAREQKQDPLNLKGSYAGAMGFGQFIPSSYRHFARDHDGDGVADIWTNKQDAIASVANYFKAHGWQTGQPVFVPAKVTGKVDETMVNSVARPEQSVAQLRKKGIEPATATDAERLATLLSYEQEQGPEYWLGFNNFYVITRYNRSQLYAMAAWQLSEAIREAKAAKDSAAKAGQS